MRRICISFACGVFFLGLGAGRVWACLNDTAVTKAEDQFRSGYEKKVEKGREWRKLWGINLPGVGALVLGAGMIGFVSVRAVQGRVS